MSLSRRDWWKILLGVAVSIIAIVIILYVIDFERLVESVRLADYRFIALLFVVSFIWLLLRGMAWRALLEEKASYADVFLSLNEGYLLNNVLPLRLGEVSRAFLLGRKANLGFLHVMSTVVVERSLDVAFAAGLLLVTLPFVVGTDFAGEAAVIAGAVVIAGLLALHLLARNRVRAMRLFDRLSERIPFLRKVGQRQLDSLFDGLGALVDARRFALVLALMATNWAVALLQFYVLLKAFFPEAQPLWAGFTLAVMAMGVAVPSSPGAVGVMEGAVMAALAAFKVDPSTALAAAITAHLTNYLETGIIGAYALARDGLSLVTVFRDVRKISPAAEQEGGK